MYLSSCDTANSVAPDVRVTVRSGLERSSAWTSIATLRGLPPCVDTTQISNPHSYTIHCPLPLMRARRTDSSVWKVICCMLPAAGAPAFAEANSCLTMLAGAPGLLQQAET